VLGPTQLEQFESQLGELAILLAREKLEEATTLRNNLILKYPDDDELKAFSETLDKKLQ